ncbi:FtsX-like permease family protein [Candidatus Nomurabacteria bacterium]|nr:FtsX-like permease family protein [Candidatus Nomurabacteria bacterium]
MPRKKENTKVIGLRRRRKRKWLTTVRMVRYGVNNFSRNLWLTIAATAVMTITLLIVFMTLAARDTLVSTVDQIKQKVDMSIYVKTDVSEEAVNKMRDDLKKLSSVTEVKYISPQEARKEFAAKRGGDSGTLNALNEATNQFPGALRINLVDINDTSQLDNFAKTNQTYLENRDPDRPASFEGPRRTAIKTIGTWVDFAEKAGVSASAVFVIISSLIVFNTIRMAIFNRKEEIQMMKLIGAEKSFIRGPFIVEAVMYGFIAALLATGIGVAALIFAKDPLLRYEVAIQPTIDSAITYIGFILLAMIAMGAIIGIVSSLLATRRYLKL